MVAQRKYWHTNDRPPNRSPQHHASPSPPTNTEPHPRSQTVTALLRRLASRGAPVLVHIRPDIPSIVVLEDGEQPQNE